MTTLYFTKQNDPNLQQIQILSKFINQELKIQQINKKYDPLILLTPQGTINQPNTILQYISNGQLSGSNKNDQLKVWEWFEHFNLELHPLLKQIYEQIKQERPLNKEKYEYSFKELLKELQLINNHLKIRTFMVGDTATVVDIHLATHLQTTFKYLLNQSGRQLTNKIARRYPILPDGLVIFDLQALFKQYQEKQVYAEKNLLQFHRSNKQKQIDESLQNKILFKLPYIY